jgi:hypothetical protein
LHRRERRQAKNSTFQNGPGAAIVVWLRISALLISQFDAVITWIGDHDQELQLR